MASRRHPKVNSSHAICINDVVAVAVLNYAYMIKQASKYKLIEEDESVAVSNILPAKKKEKNHHQRSHPKQAVAAQTRALTEHQTTASHHHHHHFRKRTKSVSISVEGGHTLTLHHRKKKIHMH